MINNQYISDYKVAKKIIWKDTSDDFYSIENIARRLLFLWDDEEGVVEKVSILFRITLPTIERWRWKNDAILSKVGFDKNFIIHNFMLNLEGVPEEFNPLTNPKVAEAFDMDISEFSLIRAPETYKVLPDYRYRSN